MARVSCWAWIAAALPLAAAAQCDLLSHTLVRASAHVVAFEKPEGTPGIVNGNTVAVIGRDAVLIVDPGQFPTSAERVLADLRTMTSAPVKYVVNTHWHGDHLLANSVYREAFPGARLIAHSFTIVEAAKRYGDDYVAKTRKGTEAATDFYRKKRDGASDDEKQWIDTTFDCVAKFGPELERTRPVLPEVAVDDRLDVDLGGVTASIRHLGTGNTPGDLVVWVPEDRVVATGDIVVYPAPYAIGSSLAAWPATVDAVLALSPAVIVPGHGPVMRDRRYLDDVRALLAGIGVQIDKLKAAGATKAEAVQKLDTAAFRERYIRTPMQRQAFDKFFVRSAVEAAWPKDKPAT